MQLDKQQIADALMDSDYSIEMAERFRDCFSADEWEHIETEIKMRLCSMCEGKREVEVLEYECNDTTGFNTIVSGTGKFMPCPECSLPEDIDTTE